MSATDYRRQVEERSRWRAGHQLTETDGDPTSC